MAHIIAADEIKKSLPGYAPEQAEIFHAASARLADKAYAKAIKEQPEETVILMSGGAASGKSEYVSVYLGQLDAIIVDGTLPSIEGAGIKIRNGLKAGKHVEIRCVMPSSLLIAFVAFLNRDRKFPVEHFYRTHSGSRKTLLEVAEQFPNVPIKIIISNGDEISGMTFTEKQFADRQQMIEFVKNGQYTEQEIRNRLYHD
jgi:hypothetical protein